MSLGDWTEQLISYAIEQDDYLRRKSPFFRWQGYQDDLLLIYDAKHRKSIEVEIHDKMLYCREDENTECIHIGFLYAVPEVYKRLKEYGFNPLRQGSSY